MNCPRCKMKLETVALGVTGVADFWIDDAGFVVLDRKSVEVTALLDGTTNLQECPQCGTPFGVVVALEPNAMLPRYVAVLAWGMGG